MPLKDPSTWTNGLNSTDYWPSLWLQRQEIQTCTRKVKEMALGANDQELNRGRQKAKLIWIFVDFLENEKRMLDE